MASSVRNMANDNAAVHQSGSFKSCGLKLVFIRNRSFRVRPSNRQPSKKILLLSRHPDELPPRQRRLRRGPGPLDRPLVRHGTARVAVPLVPEAVHALLAVRIGVVG